MKDLDDAVIIDDISHFIDNARYDYDQDNQTLKLVILQKYRDQAAAGAIEPKFWDDGAPAAWTSYQFMALSSTTVLVKRHLHGLVWSRGSTQRKGCVTTALSDNAGWGCNRQYAAT